VHVELLVYLGGNSRPIVRIHDLSIGGIGSQAHGAENFISTELRSPLYCNSNVPRISPPFCSGLPLRPTKTLHEVERLLLMLNSRRGTYVPLCGEIFALQRQ